ncbi:ANK_REP_REGION domain-containing protein [Durusdinium trenchii]|uniref:ANK_REP_REGION domain-containing protein n=1 Tax=Durusdinium trenchii TaxID=1381693 RepID=A0ABP0PAJ4_9DINO
MNFRVSLSLNDSALTQAHAHTVYPVLLASADFQDWWVSWPNNLAHGCRHTGSRMWSKTWKTGDQVLLTFP